MNVSLPRDLEEFVDEKVEGGRYTSASEVVREGLRLLEEQDKLKAIRFEEIERKLMVGVDQLDRKQGVPATKVFKEIKRRSLLRRQQKHD